MRTVEELLSSSDPAWPLVRQWISDATRQVDVLPVDPARAREALFETQVTIRSPLGAVIYETGGILVDRGWCRVLGSGSERLQRSVPSWNAGRTIRAAGDRPKFLLIADDVLGGFFALNGGALQGAEGSVNYFAPDTLEWEDLGLGYTGFLQWLFSGDVSAFYGEYRWPGWEEEVSHVAGDEGLFIYPFLSAEGPSIGERHRGRVPIDELYKLSVA